MRVGIVGLGLIGGSISLALREPGTTVLGYEPDAANLDLARARGCIDDSVQLEDLATCDLVFIACPPRAVVDVCRRLRALRVDLILSDCASTKGEILEAVGEDPWFVGGHPMAGHEKSGPGYASGWLFKGAKWFLTPTGGTKKEAVRVVTHVVKRMGAEPVRITGTEHDRHVAIVSHLPHILAAMLVTMATDLQEPAATGGSWRDLTRVAGVDAQLWTQILTTNRSALATVLAEAIDHLEQLRIQLEAEEAEIVRNFFERAKLARARNEVSR